MGNDCPTPDVLVAYASGSADMTGLESFEEHLASCEICGEDVVTIRQAAAELRHHALARAASADGCLDELALAELVDGTDGERRKPMLTHLATCSKCLSEVAGLVRILDDVDIRRELTSAGTADAVPPRRRGLRIAGLTGLAAAAALVLLVIRPWSEVDSTGAHRAPTMTMTAPPVAVSPTGSVAAPSTFVWTSVPRADRYEITLFDREGSAIWEAQTGDTSLALPNSVELVTGTTYFWRVKARTDFDRWSESELVEFTLTGPSGAMP